MPSTDSGQPGHAFAHQLQAESTQPFAVHFNALAKAAWEYVLQLQGSGALRELNSPLAVAVITHMLTQLDPQWLPRLVVRCSQGWLADQTGRAVGHIRRQLKLLEQMELLEVIERGGGTPDHTSAYRFLEYRAQAHRGGARWRADLNRALARGYGEGTARRRAKDPMRRRAQLGDTKDCISAAAAAAEGLRAGAHRSPDADSPAAANAELLRNARVCGDPTGLDDAGITFLSRHANCTPEQIRIAVDKAENLKRRGKLEKSPAAVIWSAIVNKYSAPPTPAERREAKEPEHRQEEKAHARQEAAARDARQNAIAAELGGLPKSRLDQLVAEVLDDGTLGAERDVLARFAAKGRVLTSAIWLQRLHEKLHAPPATAGERNPDVQR